MLFELPVENNKHPKVNGGEGGELGVGIRLSSEVNPYEDDVSTVFSI